MMKKWFRRTFSGVLILIVFAVVAVNIGMRMMEFSDTDANEYFRERGFEGVIENKIIEGQSIKIISDSPQESDSILLVFVHGAPGAWDAFKEYIVDKDLESRARIVAYDRPGYGNNDSAAMPSIQKQSDVLKSIVKSYGLKRNILVGHSYGGSIVGCAGLDDAIELDAVVMIAPLLDPISEPLFWYSYFSYWKLTSWLLPSSLVVAGSEKFAHSCELEKIEDQWQNANCSFIHVHGLKDGLAPGKENIAFARSHIPKHRIQTISYEDKGHLVIWSDFELMKGIIMDVINNI